MRMCTLSALSKGAQRLFSTSFRRRNLGLFKETSMNPKDFQSVEYKVVGQVAQVTLSRPEHLNAIDLLMPGELERSIELANFDDNVKVILLSGKNVFCSGYDLKLGAGERGVTPGNQKMPWDPYTDYRLMNRCNKAWMSIWHSLKPVVAKIRGVAIGGGSDIALCCDVTFASEDARIGYPPSRIWGCPTTAMWCYRVGMERAKRILFAGEILSGKKAADIGLIGEAVADEDLDSVVDSFIDRIITVPTNQLFFQKQVINQVIEQMGLLNTQRLATVFDGMSRHTPEGVAFHARMQEVGFKKAVKERDSRAITVWSNADEKDQKSKL